MQHEASQRARREASLQAARAAARVCANDACPTLIRADCAQWLFELENAVPSVVFHATVEGVRKSDGVRVFLDGELIQERLSGDAIELEPGIHDVRFETDGYPPKTEVITVRDGEKKRAIVAKFSTAPISPDGGGIDVPMHRPVPKGVWALLGVGVGGLASFAVLYGVGRARYADLEDTCKPFCEASEGQAVRGLLIGSYVSVGVGGAAMVASLAWYLARPRVPIDAGESHEKRRTPKRAAYVRPAVSFDPWRGEGRIGVIGTF